MVELFIAIFLILPAYFNVFTGVSACLVIDYNNPKRIDLSSGSKFVFAGGASDFVGPPRVSSIRSGNFHQSTTATIKECITSDPGHRIDSIKFNYQYSFGYGPQPAPYTSMELRLVSQKDPNIFHIIYTSNQLFGNNGYSWDLCTGQIGCYSPINENEINVNLDISDAGYKFVIYFTNNNHNVHIAYHTLLLEINFATFTSTCLVTDYDHPTTIDGSSGSKFVFAGASDFVGPPRVSSIRSGDFHQSTTATFTQCIKSDKLHRIDSIRFNYQYSFGYGPQPAPYTSMELRLVSQSDPNIFHIIYTSDELFGNAGYSWDLCTGQIGCYSPINENEILIDAEIVLDNDKLDISDDDYKFIMYFTNNNHNVHIAYHTLLLEITFKHKQSYEWIDARDWSQFPYMVLLINCDNTACDLCGGSILSLDGVDGKGAILTAAHCVPRTTTHIYVGSTTSSPTGTHIIVTDTKTIHPNWDGNNNDIAILYLPSAIIHPAATSIELESDINAIPNNARVAAIGYVGSCVDPANCIGSSDRDTLEYTFTHFMEKEECKSRFGHHVAGAYEICVKDDVSSDGYTSLCGGDSGSPLVYNNKQIGITSWGVIGNCDPNNPQVLASIPAYYDWIKLMTGEHGGNAMSVSPRLLYEFNDASTSTTIKESMSGGVKYDLILKDNAKIALGVLNCNGGYAESANNIDFALSSHTMAVKVKLTNLQQTLVSGIAIDSNYDDTNDAYSVSQFDAILYNSVDNDAKWMHGSEYYRRTQKPLNGASSESVINDWIHMVAVYNVEAQLVTMYRDGAQYGDSFTPNDGFMSIVASTTAGDRVLFCLRHHRTAQYYFDSLQGSIEYGAIYDTALNANQVKDLYENGPFVPNIKHDPIYQPVYNPNYYFVFTVSQQWIYYIAGVIVVIVLCSLSFLCYKACVCRNKTKVYRYGPVKFDETETETEV